MTAETIAKALGGRKAGATWMASCLAHDDHATAQPTAGQLPEDLALVPSGQSGLALDRYATARLLPIYFLKTCGLSEFTLDRKPAVRIPYFGVGGEQTAARFRIARW